VLAARCAGWRTLGLEGLSSGTASGTDAETVVFDLGHEVCRLAGRWLAGRSGEHCAATVIESDHRPPSFTLSWRRHRVAI
jgi:hypothetical protein